MPTQKPKPKAAPELSEKDAECLIYEALKREGKFLPQTPAEVAVAEAELGDAEVELPPALRDPLALLARKSPSAAPLRTVMPDASAVENMACAAKNGSDIPPDVLAQMDADEAQADIDKEPEDGKK